MSEEADFIKNAAEGTAKGLSKLVPKIYPDLLQPSVKELGKGLQGAIKLALAPLTSLVWGYEKIGPWLVKKLEERLKDVPFENIVKPKSSVVWPAIEAIRFLEDDDILREMFGQLIASAMNKKTCDLVHPGFVEIIRNLSPEDAVLLNEIFFKTSLDYYEISWHVSCNHFRTVRIVEPEINIKTDNDISINIDNLNRLGLIDIHSHDFNTVDEVNLEKLMNTPVHHNLKKEIGNYRDLSKSTCTIYLNNFSKSFCFSCI